MNADHIARTLGDGRERQTGTGFRTFCPVHEADGGGHSPSLDIDVKDGRVLLKCRTGCEQSAIVNALRDRGLWSNGNGASAGSAITRYEIRDLAGALKAVHVRLDNPPSPKKMWWERDGKNGLGGQRVTALPLYATEHLKVLVDGTLVVVTEGEKACASLMKRGISSVGTVTGATGEGDLADDAALAPLLRFTLAVWPDADPQGSGHMRRLAQRLQALGNEPRWIDWQGPYKGADAADFAGSPEQLLQLIDSARPWSPEVPTANSEPIGASESLSGETEIEQADERVWPFQAAEDFLAEEDDDDRTDWIVEKIVAPASTTLLVSPRGLGKTMILHALAVSIAKGTLFVGRPVKQGRVALIDRDNPRRVVKNRLRRWGAAQSDRNFHVVTRGNGAHPLTRRKEWAAFPAEEYACVFVDSLGASTEGVDETEGGESSSAIAPLLDIASLGPAVVVLANTDKAGAKIRGSGVFSDRVDIIFEIRDVTGITFDPRKETWMECLPEAGEQAWLDKSKRRKQREVYRLAFFASKFRMAGEIDPFVLEIHVPAEGEWDVIDVTAQMEIEHDEAKRGLENSILNKRESAVDTLRQKIAEGAALSKTEAQEFLQKQGLKQKEARETLAASQLFTLEKEQTETGRGRPKSVLKLETTEEVRE